MRIGGRVVGIVALLGVAGLVACGEPAPVAVAPVPAPPPGPQPSPAIAAPESTLDLPGATAAAPTPAPGKPGLRMKGATQLELPGGVEFEPGKATLRMSDETTGALACVLAILQDHPEITLLSIEGHTDDLGEPRFDNTRLSQSRATAVLQRLVDSGVARSRLEAVGYGSTLPLFPSDSPEHMALNRRVEFHVLGLQHQPVIHQPAPSPPRVP